jgi:hypothetical protein
VWGHDCKRLFEGVSKKAWRQWVAPVERVRDPKESGWTEALWEQYTPGIVAELERRDVPTDRSI